MDETAIAFELPHARAARDRRRPAARPHLGARLHPRRSRSAPSAPSAASPSASASTSCSRSRTTPRPQDDDVDKVISYDTITEAIEARARRRADQPPRDPGRARRRRAASPIRARCASSCRIEKLDRIPGALGVEIVRSRAARGARARLRPVDAAPRAEAGSPTAWSSISAPALPPAPTPRAWRDALAALGGPLVLCLGAGGAAAAGGDRGAARASGFSPSSRRPGRSPTRDPRFGVAATRTELDWALKSGRLLGLGAVAHG